MRIVPDAMTTAWKSPDKTGPRRPVVRATVQQFGLVAHRYDTSDQTMLPQDTPYMKLRQRGYLNSALFGQQGAIREISNLRTCSWSRGTNQDVAECTLTMLNTELRPLGTAPLPGHADDYDAPGAMTPTRGDAISAANRWGYSGNTGWQGMIIPDRMVKTYEGYGCDVGVYPAEDPHLKQSGTWIIDDVEYSSTGDISLKMRDLGRLLLDTIVFPPAVPPACYPLSFSARHNISIYHRELSGGSWTMPAGTRVSSSNQRFIGKGIQTSDGSEFVHGDGSVLGHYPQHALTEDDQYWMSTGFEDGNAEAWLQFDFPSVTRIAGLQVASVCGPYVMHVHIMDKDGRWIGKKKLKASNYAPSMPGGGSYPSVQVHPRMSFTISRVVGGNYMSDGGTYGDHGYIPESLTQNTYETAAIGGRNTEGIVKAKAVRITFKRLQAFPMDPLHPRRAAIDYVKIYTGPKSTLKSKRKKIQVPAGNYEDWSDVVRWMLGWGGWFWPEPGTGENYMPISPTERNVLTYDQEDGVIPRGALWADIQDSGTGGVADLGIEMFDKKPFFDVISEVRDTLGFIAFIDETGGFVFRMPNVWKQGNYLTPDDLNARGRSRTSEYVVIDEEETLLSYKMSMSSRSSRETVFVGDSTARIGWATPGYDGPYRVNLGRVAGWTDKNLLTTQEAKVAADMIVTRQMFAFRRGQVTIPGNPAIQIDDQVKILERVTNEMFFHYVESISSELDMMNGTWTYQLGTHWLGEDADGDGEWAVSQGMLAHETKQYLHEMGSL